MHSVFDAHCDTITRLGAAETLADCPYEFNLEKASRYDAFVQVTAIWIDRSENKNPYAEALAWIDKALAGHGDARLITSAADVRARGTAILLGVEGGAAIEGDLAKLHTLYQKGVRLLTLTWNTPNEISDTAMQPLENGGLTPFGKQVVAEMERLGMAPDVSHLSDAGFWDLCEVATKPFIASHSNARALCDVPRNLTDDQFRAIAERGGVVGINFYTDFLGGDSVTDIVRHIEHFMALGGEKTIGFGSDFDGIDRMPKELCGAESFDVVTEALLKQNYTEKTVRDIAFGNMERFFKTVL